MGFPEVDMSP